MDNVEIKVVNNIKSLEEFLKRIDTFFPIALSSKVNLKQYAEKAIEKGINFYAVVDNQIIGVCMGYANDYKEYTAYISTLAVIPEYRNMNVGKKLIDMFKEYAIKSKMRSIRLFVYKDNERAIHFYKKNRFERIEKKANYEFNITMQLELSNISYNILLTSVGRRGYLVKYFKEALENERKSICFE